jgi:hypothetical protein
MGGINTCNIDGQNVRTSLVFRLPDGITHFHQAIRHEVPTTSEPDGKTTRQKEDQGYKGEPET